MPTLVLTRSSARTSTARFPIRYKPMRWMESRESPSTGWLGKRMKIALIAFYYLRNIYTARRSTIFVQTLEGHFRKALYRNVTKMPRALVVNAPAGHLYGSDWGSSAFIYKAASDGSKFEKIIIENIVWPNALTIDIYAKRLYWADAFLDTIQ